MFILNANEMDNTYITSNKALIQYLRNHNVEYILAEGRKCYYINSDRLKEFLRKWEEGEKDE